MKLKRELLIKEVFILLDLKELMKKLLNLQRIDVV